MRRSFFTVLLALLVVVSITRSQGLGGPQAPVAKASIEGIVVRAPGGEPLARALLTITRVAPAPQQAGQPPAGGQPAPLPAAQPGAAPAAQQPNPNAQAGAANPAAQTVSIAPVVTDDLGHFQLKDLDPGTYRLYAAHNGFARMEYGQKLMYRPGTILSLTAGQVMKDVTFRLTPAGTVTGRVVDDQGDPMPGINVQILRSVYDANGKRTLQPAGNAKSNDLGEYRVYFVAPGRYYVSASAGASGIEALMAAVAQQAGAGQASNEVVPPGYVTSYYPNTVDSSRAQAIEVQPGSEISGIHFTLVRQQRFRVKGRIMDIASGQPPQTATISLSARNSVIAQNPLDSIMGAAAGGNNYDPMDGAFELRDVSPGSYWLQILAQGKPPSGAAASTSSAAISALANMSAAMLPLEVSGGDVENMTITMGTGISIPGKIQVEGAAANFAVERTVLVLIPTNGVISMGLALQQTSPGSDGTFTINKVNAGEYRFVIASLAPTMFVKSARFDQTDILDSGFVVGDRSPGMLQVVVSANGGRIEGNVVDKENKTVRGIPTVLIPDRNRDRRDVYKVVNTDQNGHFTMVGIVPGDYKLFAWEDIEPFSYNDPEVLKQFDDKGQSIHIVESDRKNVEVRLIPAPAP